MFDQDNQLRAGLLRPDALGSESVVFVNQVTGNFLQVMLAVYRNRRETVNLIITDIKLSANVRNPLGIHIFKYIDDDFGMFSGIDYHLKGNSSPSVSGKSMKPFSEAVLAKLAVLVAKSPL